MALEKEKIRFVVLMLENRSFDHLLGYLRPGEPGFLSGAEANAANDGSSVPVSTAAAYTIDPPPGHNHANVRRQMFGDYHDYAGRVPSMAGFVRDYEQIALWADAPLDRGPNIMKCFVPDKVRVIRALAESYCVCSNWFSSVPGATWPNRNFAHAATSDGEVNIVPRFYYNKTIFEQLQEANPPRSWAIYHDGIPQSWAFPRIAALPGDGFRSMQRFVEDVENDALPDYTFIEPNHTGADTNSMHPGYIKEHEARFRAAERLVANVYSTLSSKAAVWEKTVLLVTFDEHGGFYDHVVPDVAVAPDDKTWHGIGHAFRFDRLGVRVPTIVVSPWVKPGSVDPTHYDHTSIIATARNLFAPNAPPLTKRDAAAPDILDLLTEAEPHAPIVVPQPIPAQAAAAATALGAHIGLKLDEFDESLIWLAQAVAKRAGNPAAVLPTPAEALSHGLTTLPALDAFAKDAVARFRNRNH